jgi:hypothetical protein
MKISRRGFLINTGVVLGNFIVRSNSLGLDSLVKEPFAQKTFPDAYYREGGLVMLPSHGTAYVASDFHGRVDDFKKWLDRTNLVSRIKNNEDVYGIQLGDVTDVKPGDPYAPKDGDLRIVNMIIELENELRNEKNRFIYLQGNHESEDVRFYELIKKGLMPDDVKKRVLLEYNFVQKMTDAHSIFLKNLPVLAWGKNRTVYVHGGPSKKMRTPKDIIKQDEKVVRELQWNRPHLAFQYLGKDELERFGYDYNDVEAFLKKMDNATLLITGHTPTQLLPRVMVKDGVGFYGPHQVLLDTSYGTGKEGGKYLVIDLGKQYKDNTELRFDKEIMPLSPEARFMLGARTLDMKVNVSHALL